MATNKYIHELSGVTNPSLTGFTVYDDETSTFKLSLSDLRQTLVDSGSHNFTGNQFIDGDLTINGSIIAQQYVVSSSITNITNYNISGSSIFGNSLDDTHQFTGSLSVTGSFSLNGKDMMDLDSYATTGSNTFKGDQSIIGGLIIGSGSLTHGENVESLHVFSSGSYNLAHFEGTHDIYLQVNIKNTSNSSGASSDLVCTADNGDEEIHYVNLGINSSGWEFNENSIGEQNDSYLFNVGRNLYIGTMNPPSANLGNVYLFASNSWRNPQISIYSDKTIAFNTSSVTDNYVYEFSGSVKLNDELNVIGSVSASYFIGDGSQLTNLPIVTGSFPHLAYFNSHNSVTSSVRFNVVRNGEGLSLGTEAYNQSEPERLLVDNGAAFNIATFQTSTANSYAEVNIRNFSSGSDASADLVLWNDATTENIGYFNLGINSSTNNGSGVGFGGDAYIYNEQDDLYIGSFGYPENGHVHLFGGGNFRRPQISIFNDKTIGFNLNVIDTGSLETIPSSINGFIYEFSGSVKLRDELTVDGSVTASYFVGDGSQLTNLPIQTIDSGSFAITGSNIFLGNQTISGSILFDTSGSIESIPNSSGDGVGASTMILKPDSNLSSDQYVVLDPTAPNHIHIRGGGTIDNSNSVLFLGGEKINVQVEDNNAVRLKYERDIDNWYSFFAGSNYTSGSWYEDNGSYYIEFTTTNQEMVNRFWEMSNNFLNKVYVYDDLYNQYNLSQAGSFSNPSQDVYRMTVIESPTSSPLIFSQISFQIFTTQTSFVDLSTDVNIEAADDIRMYSHDVFSLRNYSATEGIDITVNYDDNELRWDFKVNGASESPNTIAGGAFSHTEGYQTNAYGSGSHAEGYQTVANGDYSHTQGYFTRASGSYQNVIGKYNLESDSEGAFIIGNGTGLQRSNLLFAANNSVEITGSLTVSGSVNLITPTLLIGSGSGDEGGEIMLAKPETNTTLTGSGIVVDSYRDRVRIFEQDGSSRGAFLDISKQSNGVSSEIVTSPNIFSIQTITSASYASITPVSGTLYIIID